ncbi:hypothetical protein RI543_000461 [Arxiozyma heterogenica]|uniref:Uncharacterized protein n=1 Tax=Arxiozyma heterogenica TaxID=278026 RepID=A0AAN7WPA2_9SACH|nr:hypothetical protein RI543_000461 [Kazachstania heterogenica]
MCVQRFDDSRNSAIHTTLDSLAPPVIASNFHRLETDSPSKKWTLQQMLAPLFSRLRSRSLSQLSRQITPPTKNGHAPPPTKSRKSSQSVNPYCVWTW